MERIRTLRKQLGQGMSEYMIVTALVAIAGIATYSQFGHTVRDQMAAVANGLAGDASTTTSTISKSKSAANAAATQADKAVGLNNFDTNVAGK